MPRTTPLIIAAALAAAALAPTSSALADTGAGAVPQGQIEFSQVTVQVTGTNAVASFERTRRWMTATQSHVITTKIPSGKLRFEGVTSPQRELRFDAASNTLTKAKGWASPPYQSVAQEAATFAKSVAQGCFVNAGDTVYDGRSATLYTYKKASGGPCRGEADVDNVTVDKADGSILERDTGSSDGSFKQVEKREAYELMPLAGHEHALDMNPHKGAKHATEARSKKKATHKKSHR